MTQRKYWNLQSVSNNAIDFRHWLSFTKLRSAIPGDLVLENLIFVLAHSSQYSELPPAASHSAALGFPSTQWNKKRNRESNGQRRSDLALLKLSLLHPGLGLY